MSEQKQFHLWNWKRVSDFLKFSSKEKQTIIDQSILQFYVYLQLYF